MPDAADIQGTVFHEGTITCMSRVYGADNSVVTQATIPTVAYSIFLIDEQDADSLTAVTGHAAVSLTNTDVIYDTLQTDSGWDKDAIGFNFKHIPVISSSQAFAIAGRKYRVEYTLTPTSGQVIKLRFRLNCI